MTVSAILKLVGLWVSAIFATVIPRMIPVAYSAIAGLLINGFDPLLLLIVSTWWAVTWTISLWFIDRYFSLRFTKKFGNKFKNTWRLKRKWIRRLHDKLQNVQKASTLFWIVAFTTRSEIPDILIIKYCRWKIGFPLFVLATILGKTFVYLPIIYGIELLWRVM